MTSEFSNRWQFRIGFLLSAFSGFAWGLVLGWALVRLNAYLSAWLTLGVTLPLLFWGSLLAGLGFNVMLPRWHKLVRWLVAIPILSAGSLWGILWALIADGMDPVNLIRSTGWTLWQLEGVVMLVGLLGGIYPRWTLPFLRLLGHLARGALAVPLHLLQRLGDGVLWLPRQMLRALAHARDNVRALVPMLPALPSWSGPASTSSPARPRTRRVKPAQPRPVHNRNNDSNGARIVAHIEDRCPYCLDVIKPNDPRGVRVCEVCHTPHHADCWAIAGKCQMPHLNL